MTDVNRCVLIVEDEMLVALVARDIFDELGFGTLEAATAEEALKLAQNMSGRLTAALIDLGLPDMPGEQLIARMSELYPDLPLIVASGKGTAKLEQEYERRGKMRLAPKPYTFDDIKAAVEALAL